MINAIFNFINQGWVGSLIGVIGVFVGIIGIFSYKFSRAIAKPSYQRYALRLIGREENNLPPDVEVHFRGKPVERLTKTTIIFWNDGSDTLRSENIVSDNPINIAFSKETEILSADVIKKTKDVNKAEIELVSDKPNIAKLNFDYLDPKDGFTIELLHTASERYPNITGTIKGIPTGICDLGRVIFENKGGVINNGKRTISLRKLTVLMMLLGSIMTIIGLLPNELISHFESFTNTPTLNSLQPSRRMLIIFGPLYFAMPFFLLWSRRKKYPKELNPEEQDS